METNPSLVAGVFREQANAHLAIRELKQAGFTDDQISLKSHDLKTEGMPDASRTVVTVLAGDRNQEAADIFVKNGANNADLPAGMILDEGTPVHTTTSEAGNAISTPQEREP